MTAVPSPVLKQERLNEGFSGVRAVAARLVDGELAKEVCPGHFLLFGWLAVGGESLDSQEAVYTMGWIV